MRWSSSNGEKERRKGRSRKYIHAADCCPNYNNKVSPKERLAQDSPRWQCRTSSTAVLTRVDGRGKWHGAALEWYSCQHGHQFAFHLRHKYHQLYWEWALRPITAAHR